MLGDAAVYAIFQSFTWKTPLPTGRLASLQVQGTWKVALWTRSRLSFLSAGRRHRRDQLVQFATSGPIQTPSCLCNAWKGGWGACFRCESLTMLIDRNPCCSDPATCKPNGRGCRQDVHRLPCTNNPPERDFETQHNGCGQSATDMVISTASSSLSLAVQSKGIHPELAR